VAGPWKAAVAVCILQLAVCAHAFVSVPPPTLLGHPGATCARAHRASSLVCLKAQLTATELPTAEAFTTLANAKLRKVDANGVAADEVVRGDSLFADSTAVIFATRRPG